MLLTIEEDMFHERMRKEIMLTPIHATIKVEGTNRHRNGENIPDSSITVSKSKHNFLVAVFM